MFKRIVSAFVVGYTLINLAGCSCSRPNPPPEKIPGLYIESVAVPEGHEGIQKLELVVVLTPERGSVVTVDYDFVTPTLTDTQTVRLASADVDYAPGSKGTLTFNPGETEKKISIDVVGDKLYERDEILAAQISNASGADIIVSYAIGTIENDDPAPVAKLTVLETGTELTESGMEKRNFEITLDAPSGLDTTLGVNWSESSGGSSTNVAYVNVDYLALDDIVSNPGNTIVIPAGEVKRTFGFEVVDDGIVENTEPFSVVLTKSSEDRDVTISPTNYLISFTILDNDIDKRQFASPLNDTGIQHTLAGLTAGQLAQTDGKVGRDALAAQAGLTKTGGGVAGFDFTKLDDTGQPLADQSKTYDVQPWSCVKDNQTKLVWETKSTNTSSLHSNGRAVSWYDPDSATSGGDAGLVGSSDCFTVNENCNTAYFVARVNQEKLCGLTGWRVPTLEELRGIAYYANSLNDNYSFDQNYFNPFYLLPYVWSSTTVTGTSAEAWVMDFKLKTTPDSTTMRKSSRLLVIPLLVNDHYITPPTP